MSLLNGHQEPTGFYLAVLCWRCDTPMRIKTISPKMSSAPLDEIVYVCPACKLERQRIVPRGD
jgi:hypothetical protein